MKGQYLGGMVLLVLLCNPHPCDDSNQQPAGPETDTSPLLHKHPLLLGARLCEVNSPGLKCSHENNSSPNDWSEERFNYVFN